MDKAGAVPRCNAGSVVGASCGSGRRWWWVLTDAAHPAHEAGAQPPLLPGEMPPLHHPSPGRGAQGPGKAASRLLGKGLWWHHQLTDLGCLLGCSPSHRATSYPRRRHQPFLLQGIAPNPIITSAAASPAPCASPGAPSLPGASPPVIPMAGKAARKAPGEEGAELLPHQQAPGLFSLVLFSS